MLQKKCPNCRNNISLKYAREYAEHDEMVCPYCRKTLTVNMPMAFAGSAVTGAVLGVLMGSFTSIPVMWVVFLSATFCLVAQGFIEFLLFDLSVKDESPY